MANRERLTAPIVLPFSAERNQVAIDGLINGQSVRLIVDTGADPSAIDMAVAKSLGLKLSEQPVGQAEGVGTGQAELRETSIEGLTLGGATIDGIPAAAFDISQLQAPQGPRIHGILGYTFLQSRIVLIDYPANRLVILAAENQAERWAKSCAARHRVPLTSFEGDMIPVVQDFRIGSHRLPASIDTGSSLVVSLFQNVMNLPGVAQAFEAQGEAEVTGARGRASRRVGSLRLPIGLGPFELAAGQTVQVRTTDGSMNTRMANIGNRFMRGARMKLLLNYKERTMTFLGKCAA